MIEISGQDLFREAFLGFQAKAWTWVYFAFGTAVAIGAGAAVAGMVPPARAVLVAVVRIGVSLAIMGLVGFFSDPVRAWLRGYFERSAR